MLGSGELGLGLVRHVGQHGLVLRVWSRPRGTPHDIEAWECAVRGAGGAPQPDLAQALAGAGLVLSCVPAHAAVEIARAARPQLRPGVIYAELSSSSPEVKLECAAIVASAGARYADGAVLGAVVASGGAVPILASGSGASAFAATAAAMGLDITVLDGPPGAAARVKLLRSVYMKGRDALVAEMMEAAERHGLAQQVARTIIGPGEEVPFPQLAERVLASVSRHAARRADELGAAAELLRASGVEPAATEGAQRRLRLVAEAQ